MVPTQFFEVQANTLLSGSAHLAETDLMGQKDGFLTLVPKSIKS